MGYLHISNLYRDQTILLFKECYALEKVHGTSAHLKWDGNEVIYFSGGESYNNFTALFDGASLKAAFAALGSSNVVVYGEAYGGKCQGMKATYGDQLRFIVFDVQIDGMWLNVPNMAQVAESLGLEVVPWRKMPTDLEALNAERDAPSDVAQLRGLSGTREGIILRPLIELTKNNGERVIAKHKTEKFSERATPQKVIDPAKLTVLADAKAVAEEWVTQMRLSHVLDKLPHNLGIEGTPLVIKAMIEDVTREASGEIVDSKEVRAAIGNRAAVLFKERIKSSLA